MVSKLTKLQIQEKTLILHWLRQKRGPVSETMFIHEFLSLAKLNHFMLYQYLYELEKDQLIMQNGNEYELTSLGGEMLDRVIDLLPAPTETSPLTQLPTSVPVAGGSVEFTDHRYLVTLTFHQDGLLRFSLTLDFLDKDTAEKALADWIENPSPLYLTIHRQVDDWVHQY